MNEPFLKRTIEKLNLGKHRSGNVNAFLNTVSYYKISPYIDFIRNNPELYLKTKGINPEIKDNWDLLVYLYRYNIKLSSALYPYIYLLETTLKTQINRTICLHFGYEWFVNDDLFSSANKKSREYILKCRTKYFKNAKFHNYSHPSMAKNKSIKQPLLPGIYDFMENHSTLGFWIAILEVPFLWDSKEIKLKKLFLQGEIDNLLKVPTKEIYSKFKSINDLRNCICHFNQIIGRNYISTRYKNEYNLRDIFQNMAYLFNLLGCTDLDRMIGDLHCQPREHCNGNSFKSLYAELAFIHEYEIKADKMALFE